MADLDLFGARWRKSSHSAQEGQCVEVAFDYPGLVPVRDSKDPVGPALVFPTATFVAFVAGGKAGEFGTV
ncbi:DUF397 domain-containing protein [Kitasatospora sp. NPDC087315]|uniref:DUF397 domain-containing protein n=1 Tax=Kitasatospora sp. NPDC087315 TaxID=3364069 RepID=UPI003819BFB0